jgi:1,4-dihydroxy-2-naphthoyl-CoA hydrolase
MDQDAIAELTRGGLIETLGIEMQELTPERVVATMPVTPRHVQIFGHLHGGASVALAETVASIGCFLSCPPGYGGFGLEINANHLRPKRDGVLTATGIPLHRGRTTHVWDVKIADEAGRLVCVSRCTVAIVAIDSR